MVQQAFEQETNNNLLASVSEGMAVFDRTDKRIGTVKGLYMGASSETANERGTGSATAPAPDLPNSSFVTDIARAIDDEDDLPEELRSRLLHDGFIRIDGAGIFAADRYVTPDQIASVTNNRIQLRVTKDELIKR